jgi:hypothetical protein
MLKEYKHLFFTALSFGVYHGTKSSEGSSIKIVLLLQHSNVHNHVAFHDKGSVKRNVNECKFFW